MNDTHAENGSGPAFWVRWVVATAIGVLVAFAGFVVIFEIFGEPDHLLFPLLMTAVGVVFGAFQQQVLRHALGAARNWALVTGLGFGAGIALALAIGEGRGLGGKVAAGLVHGAAVGAIVGTLQWRVLHARMPAARWWVPASIGGWAIAAAVADAAGYFVDGIDIIVAPVVAAAVTGVALVRLTRPGDPSRTDHRRLQRAGSDSRHQHLLGALIQTVERALARRQRCSRLHRCWSCSSAPALTTAASSAPEPASSTIVPPAETNAAAPGSVADVAAEADSSQVCTLVSEMYEQDDLPSVEQLQRYQQLAPDEIADQVTQVAEALIADGGDPVSFFNIIAADNNEAAIAEIDAWEEKTCGIPHSDDTALPAGASRELDPDATRVDVHTTEYAFHLGDVAPGRTSFVLTNDGDETHEMLIIKLAPGVTLDEAMQAEGGGGTVEESWTTNLAAPGDDEVITFDVEPGDYGLLCFILNADGTLHALLGMQHQFTVH